MIQYRDSKKNSDFAGRHLVKGILWTGFCIVISGSLAGAGCLPGCGSGLRRDERPDELSSVLYPLVFNCQV
jgi:hypothetical protein